MTVNAGSILSLLAGILTGALFIALITAGAFGLNAATFLWVLLAIYFIVKLAVGVDLFLVIGLIIGVLLVVLIPALSPGNVMDAGLLALALIVLVMK